MDSLRVLATLHTVMPKTPHEADKPGSYYKRIGAVSKNIYLDPKKKEKLYSLADDIARRPSWVIYVLIDMLLDGQIKIDEVEKYGIRKRKKDPSTG